MKEVISYDGNFLVSLLYVPSQDFPFPDSPWKRLFICKLFEWIKLKMTCI